MRNFASIFLAIFCCVLTYGSAARSDEATDDAYAARDICTGLAANYANLPPGATFTYNAGKFKIDGQAGGRVTIFEGAVQVGQIQNLDYKNFVSCTKDFMQSFEARRKKSEINRTIAFFNVAFELNNTLYLGTCLQSAAMVGLYFGDMARSPDNAANRITSDDLTRLLVAINASLSARLSRYVNRPPNFTLDSDVKYFRYVQGREVPYFDQPTIDRYNSVLLSNVSDEYRPYVILGVGAGALARLNASYAVLLQADRRFSAFPDPSSYQRRMGVEGSLRCMEQPASFLAERLRRQLEELDLYIEVPSLNRLIRMTDQQLQYDDAVARLTDGIRKEIRNM